LLQAENQFERLSLNTVNSMILIAVKNSAGKTQERISLNAGAQFRTYLNPDGEFEKPPEYSSILETRLENIIKEHK
jgi:hypothetical protein